VGAGGKGAGTESQKLVRLGLCLSRMEGQSFNILSFTVLTVTAESNVIVGCE
jgi:hypothetical protein